MISTPFTVVLYGWWDLYEGANWYLPHLMYFTMLQETIGDLHRRACEIFDLNSEQVKT